MSATWDRFFDHLPGLLWAGLGLVAIMIAAAWVVVRLRTQYRSDEDPAALDHGILSQFGELHRQGHLSDEEYRSVKGRLIKRLDGSIRAQDKKG